MHIDRIPNRNSPPAYLLRESYREDGKVKKRTLANITHWPAGKIEALRRLLRDEYAPHEPRADLKLMRSGMLRKLGLDDLLAEGQRAGCGRDGVDGDVMPAARRTGAATGIAFHSGPHAGREHPGLLKSRRRDLLVRPFISCFRFLLGHHRYVP
jgi:hypothetical protein